MNRPSLPALFRSLAAGLAAALAAGPLAAQFRDDFNTGRLAEDPGALQGWTWRTGDGEAAMTMTQEDGFARVEVDATKDRLGIWWAMIRRRVSGNMDLTKMTQPGHELRIEARIRVSDAPKRVNLHFNTQRTTDFHSHLMEFDIAESNTWQTISMTTHGFDARPGDDVFAQMALMDWGLGKYHVDVDYLEADIVEAATAGPDLGTPLPYHPPVSDLSVFKHALPVVQDSTIDRGFPEMNFNNWSESRGGATVALLNVNAGQFTILRWDLSTFAGRKIAGSGVLELTTHAVQRPAVRTKDFGQVHVVEILRGDPQWNQATVTGESLAQGQPVTSVLNSQMIIDQIVTDEPGGKTYATINGPVLQRMIDGKTLGIAILPLGAIDASFLAMENDAGASAARLLFNLQE